MPLPDRSKAESGPTYMTLWYAKQVLLCSSGPVFEDVELVVFEEDRARRDVGGDVAENARLEADGRGRWG